ncbi:hypothetical protein ACFOKE_17200 [Enterococcus rivorum]|uniref:hypothetical protein n=1 Tax=Enterococcus rivorum TaxID=762845 RepID=UPI003623BCF5
MNRNKNYEKYLKPLSLLLITYWLFSNALNTIFPFFGKLPIDEIVYTIITVSIFRKLVVRTVKIDKKEKIIIIIYFVFIFTGWVSYVLNGQQSLQSVVLDIILLSRFIVCYFFARMCFSEGFFMDLQHSLNKLAQIITVGLFLSLILNFVIRIWPTNSIRLGIETQQLFFSHPTYLTSVAVFCLIVFYMNRNSKNYVFITLAAVIVIFGTRDKGFLFLGIYLVLLILSKIGIKSNITFLLVSTISLIPIFWDTIAYKLISSDTSARSLLYKNALQIANLYLPIGAGFAMYGSNQSIKNYSPIYNELGMNKIFGFTMENPNYLTDSFIAMVLGQFGYIGIILMIVIFLFFLLLVKGNKLRNEFGLLILIYVITSTITENFISSSFGMAFFFTLGLSINSGTEKDYGGEDKKMQDMINFEKMYKIVMAKKNYC